jgi:hypothetical protein
LCTPEKAQGLIDLLKICVRPDLRAETWCGGVPSSMQIVGEYAEPINLRLESLEVHVLQICVLCWYRDTETNVVAQSLAHVLEKLHLVGLVAEISATVGVARPFPINVYSTELVSRKELLQGVGESFAVLLGAAHLRESLVRGLVRVRELKSANADPFGDAAW